MERPYFLTEDHFNYLAEMNESGLFTTKEIREKFIETFPKLSTFKVNKIFKYNNGFLMASLTKPFIYSMSQGTFLSNQRK
jgi:hypothetical protein